VICDETLRSSMMVFVTMFDFFIERGGVAGSSPPIYDETKIFVIKSALYDIFRFVIKIFVIEVNISSSVCIYTFNM
jgi:hypothetical protein